MATQLDLKKILRELGLKAQAELAARLSAGVGADGQPLAPDKRGGSPGVRSGALLRALSDSSNVRADELELRVELDPAVATRFRFLVGGTRRQPARPLGGLSPELLEEARRAIAVSARDSFIAAANDRERGA